MNGFPRYLKICAVFICFSVAIWFVMVVATALGLLGALPGQVLP